MHSMETTYYILNPRVGLQNRLSRRGRLGHIYTDSACSGPTRAVRIKIEPAMDWSTWTRVDPSDISMCSHFINNNIHII